MTKYQVLKRQKPWRDAYYYQKSETLYQMTYVFCQRFLPEARRPYGGPDGTGSTLWQTEYSGRH